MGAKENTRRIVSPVLLAGITSFAIVTSVSALKFTSDNQASSNVANVSVDTLGTPEVSSQDTSITTSESKSSSSGATAADLSEPTQQNTEPSTSRASVTVNGTTYTATEGEQVNTTTSDSNGQTSINISVQSGGDGQQYSSASSNVHVFSNSFTTSQSSGTKSP